MCFSATASFASSALLISTGAAATRLNESPERRMFLGIPFLFGIQQAAEGLVWLSFGHHGEFLHRSAATVFLFFAVVLWPVWIPWAVLSFERERRRRIVLKCIFGLGVFASIFASWVLFDQAPRVEILEGHIGYTFLNRDKLFSSHFDLPMYLVPTVVPLLISSSLVARRTGVFMLLGLALTMLIARNTATSVWCFFSALVSFYIAAHVFAERRPDWRLPRTTK